MDDYQSDESSKKISELIEKINKWLEKNTGMKEETNKTLENSIKKLKNSLYEIVKNAEKMANVQGMIFQTKSAFISAYLYCEKLDNIIMLCTHSIKIIIHNKRFDHPIECYSYSELSPNKIQCTYFELPNSIYWIEDIKQKIPEIHKKLYPEVFENLDKQYIHMKVIDDINFENPENKNLETFKYKVSDGTNKHYIYQYSDNKHKIKFILGFDPSVDSNYWVV
jgi:hypothetical protein